MNDFICMFDEWLKKKIAVMVDHRRRPRLKCRVVSKRRKKKKSESKSRHFFNHWLIFSTPKKKRLRQDFFFSISRFFPVLSVHFLYNLKFSSFSTFSTLRSEDVFFFSLHHKRSLTLRKIIIIQSSSFFPEIKKNLK